MTCRLAMWSGPRNISTAMMRSWENRSDCSVVDEPLYAHYLTQSGAVHPCQEAILADQSSDYATVTHQLAHAQCSTPVYYQKHMTHHISDGADIRWTSGLQHCFLIRDPAQVVDSYTRSMGQCEVEDIGILQQAELYQRISALTGQDIPIIDSNDVLQNPERVLTALCTHLNISFEPAMLSWPTGRRESDGVWASHWYHNVEQSTGFGAPVNHQPVLSQAQQQVVSKVTPAYQEMFAKRLQ